MNHYFIPINYILLFATWVAVYFYFWPRTARYTYIYHRRIEKFTLVYLAFPLYNLDDPHFVCALWVAGVQTILFNTQWALLYIIPWIFFAAIIINDTYLERCDKG